VKINTLHDLIESAEDWDLLVFFEFESGLFPDLLDVVQFDLNLGFLGGSVNDFVNFFSKLEKIKLDQVLKAESRSLMVDGLGGDNLKLFPMSVHHEWRSQLVDEWKDDVHILHSLVESKECFPVLDVFVLRGLWVALLGLHILNELHEDLSVDFLPHGGFPSLKLEIDQ